MLNESQKKFISENYNKKSARSIAKSLKIPRNEVESYFNEIRRADKFEKSTKENKFLIPTLVLALLFLHIFLRFNTFWLSHVAGDQVQYAGLAMKLQNFGFNGYSLRKIDYLPAEKEDGIIKIVPSRNAEGALLANLKKTGIGYYDKPLFHKGPAFPIVLMLSHSVFAGGRDYTLVASHLGESVFKTKPRAFFASQLYASIVPLFFSAVLMLLTFALGKNLFSERIGLYAAFMIAVNPVSMLTAHKLWADDMLAVFVAGSVLLFVFARKKSSPIMSFLAGASAGIAVLAKQNAGVICTAIMAYTFFARPGGIKDIKKWPLFIFDKYLILFASGLMLFTLPWFYKVFSVYGNPIYQPPKPNLLDTDVTGWFRTLAARPHAIVLFGAGIPYLSPVFIFAYGSLKKLFTRDRRLETILLWLWIAAFVCFFIFQGGDEHRRMLPVYPAIAILAAYFLDSLRVFVKNHLQNSALADGLVILILIASALWSVPIGVDAVLKNAPLILRPF